jgi:hypothetical protein
LATSSLFANPIAKCDETVLLSTSEKIGKLNHKEIRDFLLTLGKGCRNNAEFSEWSNELIFSILDKQTDLTLTTIEKEEKKIEIDEVLDDLSSPVSDMIVVKSLIPRIEKSKINRRLKKQIIDRLKIADSKSN